MYMYELMLLSIYCRMPYSPLEFAPPRTSASTTEDVVTCKHYLVVYLFVYLFFYLFIFGYLQSCYKHGNNQKTIKNKK